MKRKKSVIRGPEVTLRWKGKRDSRLGEGVCNAYISGVYKKLAQIETNEIKKTEDILKGIREEAAELLAKKSALEHMATQKREFSDSLERLQAERELKEKRQEITQKLTTLNEKLVSANLLLDEQIHKLRNHVESKLHVYISGVRTGKIKNYEYTGDRANDRAREIYKNGHHTLDEKIRRAADAGTEGAR